MESVASLAGVTLDCPHPQALAEFYQRMGGGEIVYSSDAFVYLAVGGFGWASSGTLRIRHQAGRIRRRRSKRMLISEPASLIALKRQPCPPGRSVLHSSPTRMCGAYYSIRLDTRSASAPTAHPSGPTRKAEGSLTETAAIGPMSSSCVVSCLPLHASGEVADHTRSDQHADEDQHRSHAP